MNKRKVLALAAVILSAAILPRAAKAEPAPGAWSLGWQGIGTAYASASPSLRYVATDKTFLEVTPSLALYHQNNPLSGPNISDGQTYGLFVDVIRHIDSYKDVDLNYLIEPSFSYSESYTRPYSGTPPTKTRSATVGLSAGLEVAYFVLPNLSFGARALLASTYQESATYLSSFHLPIAYAKTLKWEGQLLTMHYYFGSPVRR